MASTMDFLKSEAEQCSDSTGTGVMMMMVITLAKAKVIAVASVLDLINDKSVQSASLHSGW